MKLQYFEKYKTSVIKPLVFTTHSGMYSQEINHSLRGCRSKEDPCDISGLYVIIIATEKKK